jgi:hypothetical protein
MKSKLTEFEKPVYDKYLSDGHKALNCTLRLVFPLLPVGAHGIALGRAGLVVPALHLSVYLYYYCHTRILQLQQVRTTSFVATTLPILLSA